MNIDQIVANAQNADANKNAEPFWQRQISFRSVWNDKSKEELYSTLLVLLSAGLDLFGAIDLLVQEYSSKKQEELILIRDGVAKGKSLSEAADETGSFSAYEVQTIRLGEESGQMPIVLKQLSKYFRNRSATKRLLTRVLVYPMFVVGITFVVIWFMLTYVVPIFADVFDRFDAEIPALTKMVISLSERVASLTLPIGILIVTAFLALRMNRDKVWFRKYKASISTSVPWFGSLVHKIFLGRFTQSMGLLLRTGTPLVDSLKHTRNMVDYYPLELAIDRIIAKIEKGKSLTSGMSDEKIFGSRMVSLVKVAEEVNQVDLIMDTLSEQIEADVTHKTSLIASVLEPVMIVFIALFVAIVLVAMYLPLFELSNVIG